MTTPTLASVIDRLEAAKEGSRELDVRISAAIDTEVGPWPEGDVQIALEHSGAFHAPRFTTSLSAAMTLASGQVRQAWLYTGMGTWIATAEVTTGSDFGTWFEGHAATPPLALCIAALKARALPDQPSGRAEVVG